MCQVATTGLPASFRQNRESNLYERSLRQFEVTPTAARPARGHLVLGIRGSRHRTTPGPGRVGWESGVDLDGAAAQRLWVGIGEFEVQLAGLWKGAG